MNNPRQQDKKRLELTLFLAGDDPETRGLAENIEEALRASVEAGGWALEVIDVLSMPEKALENEVFATPTLLRTLPTPVLKVLGDIAQAQRVLALVRSDGAAGHAVIV